MRGKAVDTVKPSASWGITPAYAGKRSVIIAERISFRDHPRLCGEKPPVQIWDTETRGSPPPMRGKARSVCTYFHRLRITPAYAGKSDVVPDHFEITGDHPRLCGEKFRIHSFITCQPGVTPAYAGKRGGLKNWKMVN